ncbi:MAG: TetR/AcrR family transcriptional regulator [Candidatus Limnocylindrales bacterium]
MVETRRQQLDEVASAMFRERGYAGTSVREIARALDLQGASLYAHMASKEDLLWSIVWRVAERFRTTVEPLAEAPAAPQAKLRAMVAAHVAIVAGEREHAAVFLHEWRFLGAERRAQIAARRDAYEELFHEVISEGVRGGTFRAADPAVAARALLSALNGIPTWYRPDGPLSPDDLAVTYADLFLAGLLADGEARRARP